MKKYVVGVDVGGTSVKFGILNPKGQIIARARLETKPFGKNYLAFIDAIAQTVLNLVKESNIAKKDILGVGVGLPGPIDFDRGVVRFLPNIPGWRNVRMQSILEKKLKLTVRIDNDVNMICLGEWFYGAAKGAKNVICITLGTGVGGGLVLNNQLYRGETFAAGEIGHMPIIGFKPNSKGDFKTFENCVGHAQLSKLAAKIYGQKKPMSTYELLDRAKAGESKALHMWQQVATYIAHGLVGAITLLNPKYVVIGGGVANSYAFLHQIIKSEIKKHAMKTQAETVRIVRAKLGDDAGIVGARVLLEQSL